MKSQLVLMADMEGASGIFDSNREALCHEEMFPENRMWREYGRKCITSDVLAVCKAANDFGIDEILLCDMHFSGCRESNIEIEKLPANVRLFDLPNRGLVWSRLRGQAAWKPFGLITVGQHARNGEENAFFSHTIHTPPIDGFYINGIHAAEIGQSVMCFAGTPYIANIGCASSHREAKELSPTVSCISVKDKSKMWCPSPEETFDLIYKGTLQALKEYEQKTAWTYDEKRAVLCELILSEGLDFAVIDDLVWVKRTGRGRAVWHAPDIESALTLFWRVHDYIIKK